MTRKTGFIKIVRAQIRFVTDVKLPRQRYSKIHLNTLVIAFFNNADFVPHPLISNNLLLIELIVFLRRIVF